jgi:hypothetical protein
MIASQEILLRSVAQGDCANNYRAWLRMNERSVT